MKPSFLGILPHLCSWPCLAGPGLAKGRTPGLDPGQFRAYSWWGLQTSKGSERQTAGKSHVCTS